MPHLRMTFGEEERTHEMMIKLILSSEMTRCEIVELTRPWIEPLDCARFGVINRIYGGFKKTIPQ